LGRKNHARDAGGERDQNSESDGLHRGHCGAVAVLFADAPGHHGGGRHADSHSDGKDGRQHRLRESHCGHGVVAEMRDPEDIDDREQRLHHHLEHHGDRQQQDCARDWAFGEVLPRAVHGFAHRCPETRGAMCG
jgi:hypothetical protein